MDCWYSIGLRMQSDGSITDVLWNGPADEARLAPGYKIIAVNGHIFSADALREAIRKAKDATEPIHLIVQADCFVSTRRSTTTTASATPRWFASMEHQPIWTTLPGR